MVLWKRGRCREFYNLLLISCAFISYPNSSLALKVHNCKSLALSRAQLPWAKRKWRYDSFSPFFNLFFNYCGNNAKVLNIIELYFHLAHLCCCMIPKSLTSRKCRIKETDYIWEEHCWSPPLQSYTFFSSIVPTLWATSHREGEWKKSTLCVRTHSHHLRRVKFSWYNHQCQV